MGLEELKKNIEEELEQILSAEFKIEIMETTTVPSLDDSDITYPNLKTGVQKCKLIETCVLYIDLRKSTDLNLTHRRETMSKLYSSFVRAIMKAAKQYNGKVRNVVGDRVMVLFDSPGCYGNAYKTAVLLNSIVTKLLNKYFTKNEIKAGIGIDYGKMLVTKAGIIKIGGENLNYKSLVWLGRPANIASKLTDLANKSITEEFQTISSEINEGHFYPTLDEWKYYNYSVEEFIENRLIYNYDGTLDHVSETFQVARYYEFNVKSTKTNTHKPILMTENVYNGVLKEATELESVKKGYIKEDTTIQVPGYNGKVYGVDTWFTVFE